MIESTFHFPSVYWLIPVPMIFAFIGLGLFHRWLGAIVVGGVALFTSLFFYDSYLTSYTEGWLAKQRIYAILFRDFPKDKDRFVTEYVRAYETGGSSKLGRKHEEMKIVIMVDYAKHYIESTPVPVIASYIKAQTWLISTLFTKNYDVCLHYLADSSKFEDAWKTAGDEIFLTSVRYNPYIITEAVYHPAPLNDNERKRAIELYRKLIRTLRAGGVHFSNDEDKTVSCDTMYREFFTLSQMPPEDAALIIKLLYSADHLKEIEPMSWLRNLMPF